MNLSNFKIGTRMYLGYGAVVLILIILVSVAYNNFARLSRANDSNVHTYQVMAQVKGALESLINIETGQRGFALTGNPASLEPYNNGKASFQTYLKTATQLTADNPQQQERLQRLGREQEAWLKEAVDPVISLRREAGEGDVAPVLALVKEGKGKRGMDGMRVLIDAIISAETSLLSQRAKEAAALQAQTSSMLIGGGVLATLLAALIAFWQTRNITVPVRRAVDLAQQVAKGDLRAAVTIDSRDEMGELLTALDSMNASLGRIVSEVRSGTDTIATASSQIMSGNMDLSARTEQQASSLEETASSMEELTSTVKQNADNARQANQLATSASEVALRGGTAVTEVVQTMGAINDSARKIVDIIGVIDGIAFQTNILALNAAVEAARAGEQGRGFAVVASEVRSLAQRSAGAAKEIKTLIDDSVEKVTLGSRLADQAGVTMEEVVSSVQRVNDIISEIASASDEQQAGIEQVNQAINQMDEVTQQNAALVEEAAAASSSMQDQAAALAQVVSIFQINETKQPAAAARPRPGPVAAPAARSARRPVANLPKPKAAPAKAPANEDWEEF